MSVSFGGKVLPTKIELIRIKRSLQVSKTIYKILEDKREVLLRRLDEIIEEAGRVREEAWRPLSKAYSALLQAYLKMGPLRLEAIAATTPTQIEVDVNLKRVVDVDVPILQVKGREGGLTYGFADTSPALDGATKAMREALPYLCRAAEVEGAIFRLAKELEKTQRLINALEYVIIPSYQDAIKFINSVLEEREREDFVRLKHIKRVLERRKAGVLERGYE